MTMRYSIAEARDRFAALVREAEQAFAVEITRRGKPVAVLLSWREYQNLTTKTNFGDNYNSFRKKFDLTKLDIAPQIFEEVRDPSPGRQVNL